MEAELRKHSSHGFTMAELLIVVAIIAVLVAIAIPVFTTQLEKSRQAVDLANTRSAYAALQVAKIEGTAPDGSELIPGDNKIYYYFTGSGFEEASSYVGTPVKLVSDSAPAFFADYVTPPSPEHNYLPELQSVRGCVLMARRYGETPTEVELTLMPGDWLSSHTNP